MTNPDLLFGETLPAALQSQEYFAIDGLLAPMLEALGTHALDPAAVRSALLAGVPHYARILQDQPFKMVLLCIYNLREVWELVSSRDQAGQVAPGMSWGEQADQGHQEPMVEAAFRALLYALR